MAHLPIFSIIIPFATAFITGIIGNRCKWLRNLLVVLATGTSFVLLATLFKPVMVEGRILTYWFGNWVPEGKWAIGIGLEVDQLSLLMGLIVSFSTTLSGIYSIKYMSYDDGTEKYYPLFLLLTGGMMGFVLTGDFFNMYVMLEIMTFAAISLVAFRTEKYQSVEAALKYIVIASIGSSFILLGTILIYGKFHTLNLAQIGSLLAGHNYDPITMFALAFLLSGYAVKAFLVPCHTWPPDAHMAAPSSISMILSSVMSKTGVYAIIRMIYTMFQSMDLPMMQYLMVFWGVITMFVGITMAISQTDLKRMLAFSSVSQIGYIVLGLGLATPLGVTAGIYHLINHVVFKSLLFLCAGAVLYRTHTTNLDELGGLAKRMPVTCALFIVGLLSIGGIPPFNGFVSKWLIYQATFEAGYYPVTIIALLCSVLSLATLLKALQSAFFGELPEKYRNVKEVPASMLIPMGILGACSAALGLFPTYVDRYITGPVTSAILNAGKYIDSMLGKGYFKQATGKDAVIRKLTYSISGYNPVGWLVVFAVVLLALGIFVFFIFDSNSAGKTDALNQVAAPSESGGKYDVYTGGENIGYTSVGGSDLFWGLKYDLRRYFGFIRKAHSGVVNDYSVWVVGTMAVLSVYLICVLIML